MVLLRLARGPGTKDLPPASAPPTHVALRYRDLLGRSVVQYHELPLRYHPAEVESGKSSVGVVLYESSAVRKGILLHHYVTFVQELLDWHYGRLPGRLMQRIDTFGEHFAAEAEALGDGKLLDEISNWEKLKEISEEKHGRKTKICAIM